MRLLARKTTALIAFVIGITIAGCSAPKVFLAEDARLYNSGYVAVLPVDAYLFMESERIQLGNELYMSLKEKRGDDFSFIPPNAISKTIADKDAEWVYQEVMKNNAAMNLYGSEVSDPDLYIQFGKALQVDYLLFSRVVFAKSSGMTYTGGELIPYLPRHETGVMYNFQLIECAGGTLIWEIQDSISEAKAFSQPDEFKIAKKHIKKAVKYFPLPNSEKQDSLLYRSPLY